jgi:hypothetical protein
MKHTENYWTIQGRRERVRKSIGVAWTDLSTKYLQVKYQGKNPH